MKLTKSQLKEMIREELKLTEATDEKWVVWIGQGSSRNRKLMKVAKSRRAALIYYNKLVNTDKYESIGMESVEHWNRTNKPKVKEGKLTEAQEPLWDKNTVKDAIKQIKKGLKNAVPYLDDIGTGIGGESIIGKISLDPKKTWSNGILQNSRWALIHFFPDGTLDTIRMNGYSSYETRKKVPILRKSKNKNLKQAIDRMGRYFTVVRTKHPDK